MYNIHQFKPTLYFLVILGLTGFAIAAEEPALWVMSAAAVLLNFWLVRKGKFSPLPRWLSSIITVAAFIYVVRQTLGNVATPVLLIGQFLVLLQIIKLFEQRANRDYAQLLILSLLLMIAAAISTASLIFGVIFIAYLFISLYCCLLFHLKVESDRAGAAQTLPDHNLHPATLRQDQRYLSRSMRRLTGLISTVSLSMAVVVFLFFPRGPGAGLFGQLQLRPAEVLTGFSDEMQLGQIAKITENNTPVATVVVTHNGKLVSGGSLRLRGVTFDIYEAGHGEKWLWSRDPRVLNYTIEKSVDAETPFEVNQGIAPPSSDQWRQSVRLEPIGAKALLALPGVRTFTPHREVKLAYLRTDETLRHVDGLNTLLEYEVVSSNAFAPPSRSWFAAPPGRRSDIAPEIAAFAVDAEVSGPDVEKRQRAPRVTEYDEDIARHMEGYFKTHFSYTLDLTDAAAQFEGRDPLAVFVKDLRRGSCEYFAMSMTLACQSLGMQARLVSGFLTDEFNSQGGFFQVRQSHAHSWVEVLTSEHGWVTFDPTSGRVFPPNESAGVWQRVKHVFEWMEYKWASGVVAYDGERRENLVQKLDNKLVNGASRSTDEMIHLRRWWDRVLMDTEFWSVSSRILVGLIVVMAAVIVGLVAWYLFEQRRIRRRAVRIGLDALPVHEQMRLARQLGFYERMAEVLQRHRIVRPRHLTPREFSRTLSYLPVEAYETVERLTNVFYRVRYGGARVQAGQQRRLERIVQGLSAALTPGMDDKVRGDKVTRWQGDKVTR